MYDVLSPERNIRQRSDFRGEQSEIEVLLDSTQIKDDVRDRLETPLQTHRVLHVFLAEIFASMPL